MSKRILHFMLILPVLGMAQWSQLGSDIDGENAGDKFGASVSLNADGTIMAVGASSNSDTANGSGEVKVFQYNGAGWSQLGNDINGEIAGDQAGFSIDLNGDGSMLVVGYPTNDDNGNNAGLVRVFKFDNGNWTLMNTIFGDSQSDLFGYDVAISHNGNILVVGAPKAGALGISEGEGRIKIYENINDSWVLRREIDGVEEQEYFGSALSINYDGSIIAAGALQWPSLVTSRGTVRTYRRLHSTSTFWQTLPTIEGDNSGDEFGCSLSLNYDGTMLAIGAKGYESNGSGVGQVKIYNRPTSSSPTGWAQIGDDIFGSASGDNLGSAVSLNGDGTILAVGASGANSIRGKTQMFENINNTWTQIGSDIIGENIQDFSTLRGAVDLSNNGFLLAVGAPNNDGNGNNSGHVRVYENPTLSNDEIFLKNQISIFPNPARDYINIELGIFYPVMEVKIHTLSGIQVFHSVYKEADFMSISTKMLHSGLYLLHLETKGKKIVKKIAIK